MSETWIYERTSTVQVVILLLFTTASKYAKINKMNIVNRVMSKGNNIDNYKQLFDTMEKEYKDLHNRDEKSEK